MNDVSNVRECICSSLGNEVWCHLPSYFVGDLVPLLCPMHLLLRTTECLEARQWILPYHPPPPPPPLSSSSSILEVKSIQFPSSTCLCFPKTCWKTCWNLSWVGVSSCSLSLRDCSLFVFQNYFPSAGRIAGRSKTSVFDLLRLIRTMLLEVNESSLKIPPGK